MEKSRFWWKIELIKDTKQGHGTIIKIPYVLRDPTVECIQFVSINLVYYLEYTANV